MLYINYPRCMSGTGRALRKALGARKLTEHSRIGLKPHMVINWGTNNIRDVHPDVYLSTVINSPEIIRKATNKLKAFEVFRDNEISHPEWTTDPTVALGWCRSGAISLCGFARTTLTGHSGRGIIPFYNGTEYGVEGEEFPEGLVYTKYIKKRKEFRAHVFKGEVIDVQEKRRLHNFNGRRDDHIRSHHNGWVYCRDQAILSEEGREIAKSAVAALGLDFGAVDLIWNEHYNKYYVLEVNTAPGLGGTTFINYVNTFRKYYNAI